MHSTCTAHAFAHAFAYMHTPCSHFYTSLHALAHMFESVHAHYSQCIQPVFHVPVSCCTFSPVRSHHYTLYCAHFHFFPIEILHSGLCSSLFPSLCSCYNRGCEANAGLYFLVFFLFFLAEPSCVQHFLCSCCTACFCCLSLIPFLKEKAILIPRWDPLFICQWLQSALGVICCNFCSEFLVLLTFSLNPLGLF